jgi:hypothetical protein
MGLCLVWKPVPLGQIFSARIPRPKLLPSQKKKKKKKKRLNKKQNEKKKKKKKKGTNR